LENDLIFPVMSIRESVFEFHASDARLRRCTKTALKNGWYRGLRILDAGGILHTVKDARFLRNTGQKTYPGLFASKWIEIDLEISDERKWGSAEARQIVQCGLSASRRTWESAGYDFPAIFRKVETAQSIKQIWNVLTPLLTSMPADHGIA